MSGRIACFFTILTPVLSMLDFGFHFTPGSTNPAAAQAMLQRKSSFSDTWKAYTLLNFTGTAGYAVVNSTSGSSLFYWQVNKYGTDIADDQSTPLVIWVGGGPGCSGEIGVMSGSGPWAYDPASDSLSVRNNTFAYDYHMMFVDAPIGTGFSILASSEELITTSQQYAEQFYVMLQSIGVDHQTWLSRPLYIFGESYAGHWIPTTAAYILQQNSIAPQTGNLVLPLAGIGVGDGWVSALEQTPGYADFSFALGLISEKQKTNITYYEQLAVAQINSGFLNEAFPTVGRIYENVPYFTGAVNATACGINIYNYRNYCVDPTAAYYAWLNNPTNKALLGVPDSIVYQDCNQDIFEHMFVDIVSSVTPHVVYVLERIPALFYSGQDDFIVNVLAAQEWLANLDWPGQEGYLNAEKQVWTVAGEVAGTGRSYGNLWQAIVYKAGHMVMQDQLAAGRYLASRFITGTRF